VAVEDAGRERFLFDGQPRGGTEDKGRDKVQSRCRIFRTSLSLSLSLLFFLWKLSIVDASVRMPSKKALENLIFRTIQLLVTLLRYYAHARTHTRTCALALAFATRNL